MEILTSNHRRVLDALGKSELANQIYFTRGTLLSYRYLQHRYSLDVDIFSDDLLEDNLVARTMKEVGHSLGARIRYVRYPSRWQYFLECKDAEIKCDIVYFPFPKAAKRIMLDEFGLLGDSLLDIAINKVHACYEREAPRDAFDLYTILQTKNWTLQKLIQAVEKKFGVSIDLVHLVARLLNSVELLEQLRPLFIGTPPKKKDLCDYFNVLSIRYLKKNII